MPVAALFLMFAFFSNAPSVAATTCQCMLLSTRASRVLTSSLGLRFVLVFLFAQSTHDVPADVRAFCFRR
jgi:hypothetical protein